MTLPQGLVVEKILPPVPPEISTSISTIVTPDLTLYLINNPINEFTEYSYENIILFSRCHQRSTKHRPCCAK